MLTEIPAEQFGSTVEEVARTVLTEVEWYRPPVNLLEVADRLNLVVARDAAMNVRARYVNLQGNDLRSDSRAGQGTIFVADDARPERTQWAVAHEVGESIAHRVFVRLGVALADIPSSARESVANQLANCLLLPRDWFAADGEATNWDLLTLKQIYSTASHELIARRMLEMTPSVIMTMFDQGALQWRNSNFGTRPPGLTPIESSIWRAAFETGRSQTCRRSQLPEGIEDIRCWPVHEPGWRREILRTELVVW